MSGVNGGGPGHRAGAALSLALLAFTVGGPSLRSGDVDMPGAPPELWVDDASVPEGDSGSQTCMFTLHLSAPVADTVRVSVDTFDSTATVADLDYESASLQVTFAPGSVAESLAVQVLGDTKFERDELFGVRLSAPVIATLRNEQAIGTIVNDDSLLIAVADTSVAEGDTLTHPLAFRVRLLQPSGVPVSFTYHTLDGTATGADQDYLPVSGDTAFAPGENQIVVEVPIVGDTFLEGNEAFSLQIHSDAGPTAIDRSATGVILNDERTWFEGFDPPVARFTAGTLPPDWGDVDGNGHPDLLLYLASGPTFVEMPGVRSQLGTGNYHGGAWCDYDRDGRMDCVLTPYDETASPDNYVHLFQNTPGGLQDVAPALGMDVVGHGETPTWGDFDGDGWPDLFVPFYSHVVPFRSYFYINLGNGQFRECADSAGVSLSGLPAALKPEGVAVADWNGDGALDLYVASHLFINDGHAHFTDVRAQAGLPQVLDEGAQFVDYDNDGDLDLCLRTSTGPKLYRNTNGMFTDVTPVLGIGTVAWDWGDRWEDVDNDGDMDFVFFSPGAAHLLLNHGDGTFEEDSLFVPVLNGRDLSSFADMDGDGDLDIAAGAFDRRLARNHLEQVPRANTSFLRVRVEDDDGMLVEQGATVRLRSLDDPRHPIQTRIVDGGSGYLGQDEYTVTFGGVGSGRYDLEVSFPSTLEDPRVIGPAQNPMLGGIRAGESGAQSITVRPHGQVTIQGRNLSNAGVEPPRTMNVLDLRPAAPNPARQRTRLDFSSSPGDGAVTLTIHDLSGRIVRTLVKNGRGADGAGAVWDLRDEQGHLVPAGLYLARLVRKDGSASVRRVTVLR